MDIHVLQYFATFLMFLFKVTSPCLGDDVERLEEPELQQLTKEENLVLVLAYAGSCENCTKHRSLLANVKEQAGGEIDGLVVVESHVASIDKWVDNDGDRGPVLLYYRNGSPIVYDGELDADMMSMWLSIHHKSFVLELDDDTFEHDTQAATGATTGHWMVMFLKDNCAVCRSMHSVWDTAAARLHGRVLFAKVKLEQCPDLKERFAISSTPTIIYFRQGMQYVMPVDDSVRVSYLVDFAVKDYSMTTGEGVKPPLQKPVELYKHLAMLVAVLFPFIILAVMWKKTPERTADVPESEVNLDVPPTPTLTPLTKKRTSTTPVRRRPSARQGKN